MAISLLALSGAAGRRLLPALPLNSGGRLAVQSAAGAGVLSTFFLISGALIGISPWLSWGTLLAGLVMLRRDLVRWAGDLRKFYLDAVQSSRTVRLVVALMIVGVLIAFIRAAAPPVKFDSLVYHLAFPWRYIADGRIRYLPDNAFWGMPQIAEMFYTWAISLTNASETAALFGWLLGLTAVAGLIGTAEQRLGASAGWISAAAFLAGATTLRSLAWAYADWFSFLYGLSTLIFLDLAYSDEPSRRKQWLVLAGAMAGFAIGTKYSAGAALLAASMVLVISPPGHWGLMERVRNLLIVGSAAAAAFAPWLIKNFIATGNPAYPFLFPSGEMTAQRLALYAGQPIFGGIEHLFLLPVLATITGHEGAPGYGASIGPLLLALAIFAGLGIKERSDQEQSFIRRLGLFSVSGMLIWAVAGRLSHYLIQPRLFFVLFPAFSLLAAAGYQAVAAFKWPGVRLGRIAGLLIVIVLGFNAVQLASELLYSGAVRVLFSQESEEDFRAKNLGMYVLAMQAVDALPPDSRVLMLFEPRTYNCVSKCDPDEFLDRWAVDTLAFDHDTGRIIAFWKTQGYTHVLLHDFGAAFLEDHPGYSPAGWAALDDFRINFEPSVDLNGIYTLYELP